MQIVPFWIQVPRSQVSKMALFGLLLYNILICLQSPFHVIVNLSITYASNYFAGGLHQNAAWHGEKTYRAHDGASLCGLWGQVRIDNFLSNGLTFVCLFVCFCSPLIWIQLVWIHLWRIYSQAKGAVFGRTPSTLNSKIPWIHKYPHSLSQYNSNTAVARNSAD